MKKDSPFSVLIKYLSSYITTKNQGENLKRTHSSLCKETRLSESTANFFNEILWMYLYIYLCVCMCRNIYINLGCCSVRHKPNSVVKMNLVGSEASLDALRLPLSWFHLFFRAMEIWICAKFSTCFVWLVSMSSNPVDLKRQNHNLNHFYSNLWIIYLCWTTFCNQFTAKQHEK